MRIFRFWLLGLLMASTAAHALSGAVVATDNVKARLTSEVTSVGPGQVFWVALALDIRDGWHTYWRNPGDSGQATKLVWTLPAGFTADDIVWTTPHRFELPPLVNYGYAGHALHLVRITAPKTLANQAPITLSAKASWLVCSDICVPESANLQLSLPVSLAAGPIDRAEAPLFAAARSDLAAAAPATVSARIQDGRLIIALGKEWGATLAQIKSLAFFPYDEGGIEYAASQTFTRTANGIELAMKLGYQPPAVGSSVGGVLVATEQNGSATVAVPMEIAAPLTGGGGGAGASAGSGAAKAAPTATAAASATAAAELPASLPVLLLFAILGGLILNLMPCVFPVLSIKAISLAEQAKKHPAKVRTKGLVFAAGVIASMLLLAAILLLLRAGGEQIGWGFQLQSPLFVTLMVYLLLAVGLNLSGVFEIGGELGGIGDALTKGGGYRATFFTGVLTTLVATPCTAPFMAAAVGAALTQSPGVALNSAT